MNIEEAKGRLKNIAKNAVEYDYLSWDEIDAIKVLLTAYEKEKEDNKRLRKCHLQYEEMTGIDLLLDKEE